ncbi:MAG: TolC family outer membrane protein [Hyphomicrobiaceae bacterium]
MRTLTGFKRRHRSVGAASAFSATIAGLSRVLVLAVALGGFAAPNALAQSLAESLAAAYTYNPQIEAERARLRATDENVARAMSGYRPTISSQLSAAVQNTNTDPSSPGDGTSRPRSFAITLTQPIFSGFRTVNAVSEAEANVRAGQQSLRSIESSVLQAAATAYVDVVRDEAILQLREANLAFLQRELQATQDRFSVGEVTRTDVAQARARQSAAAAAIDLARANLASSRAAFRRIVGSEPRRLVPPSLPHHVLPKSLAEATDIGLQQNPSLVRALYLEQAARFSVDQIFGELLPSAQLEASYSATRDPTPLTDRREQGSITGRINIPLYEAGETRARLRQSKHVHVSRIQEIELVRTEVREQVVRAWSLVQAFRAQLQSARAQVEANQIALDGVREEERVGQRTLLEVLNARQELLDSQVQLTTTQRDIVVSAYQLLAAIGRLDAETYGVSGTIYDPDAHYHQVRREWWRISITDREGRRDSYDLWDDVGRHHVYK